MSSPVPSPGVIDSHCHLPLAHAEELVAAAHEAGVDQMISVGCNRASSLEALAVAHAHPSVHATVGLHPHDAKDGVSSIRDLFDRPGVLAVGECGLDYYYEHSPRDVQRAAFAEQIALAHERHLPLVIHTRDAWNDTFEILESVGVPDRTIFHCFTGGPSEAERCLELGAYLSFSGIVTFKNANEVHEAAARCPDGRFLVETDSPYLAPVPFRGRKNQPAHVTHVAARLAELRRTSMESIVEMTRRTTMIAFSLTDS